MDVRIEAAPFPLARDLPFEVVERKGRGHPDTLCDAVAEAASRTYSAYFLTTYGRLAHHWFDKVMLLGGQARLGYLDGEITQPYRLVFAGKGVRRVATDDVPLDRLFRDAAREVFDRALRNFDVDRDLVVVDHVTDYRGTTNAGSRYTPATRDDLVDASAPQVSNDCNVCSGFAALSPLERAVLELERYLTSAAYLSANPHTGTDVKIVGLRNRRDATIVVNVPMIAAEVSSYGDYQEKVAGVADDARRFLGRYEELRVAVTLNPEDVSGVPYLTVTGSVADTGDIGVVGRGNRLNGLITPMRPMSIEAAAGKNPIDHTGKLYGLLSQQVADGIHERFGIENQAHLVTFKERPIADPQEVVVYIHADGTAPVAAIAEHVREQVARTGELTSAFADRELELC